MNKINILKKIKHLIITLSFSMIILVGCTDESTPTVLRVAIPYSDNIQNPNSNYYINWLESQTNIDIIPIMVKQTRCDEYLNTLFDTNADIDIVLFGNNFQPSDIELKNYIDSNKIYCNSNNEYVYMNYGTVKSSGCGQTMWINANWLKELSLKMPENTEELENVLTAFKNSDPNGNNINDEIAIIGCMDNYSLNPSIFLINSFIYNDPYNTRFYIENGKEYFAPEQDAYIEGLKYCKRLYENKLLDERCFYYTKEQMCELINSPVDMVGAFTSDSIADVIYQGNPEIMSRYIALQPVKGPDNKANALYYKSVPTYGAIIVNGSGKEKECEKLLNTMMTVDASLIARFGEQGVDWDYSDGLDVSIYGTKATIETKNYIWNTPQNKHLNGSGPLKVPDEYLNGVTWNGVNSDLEYIDARAEMIYKQFFPEEVSTHGYDNDISSILDKRTIDMIKGDLEIDKEKLSWNSLSNACSSNNGLQ